MAWEENRDIPFSISKTQGKWPPPKEWLSIQPLQQEISKLGDNITGCEIGASIGVSTIYILDNVHAIKKMYTIDPFDGTINLQLAKQFFLKNISEPDYNEKIVFIEKTSDDAVNDIADNELDFVFIDGLHTTEQVYKDILNYYPKLRSGGLISGHDWPMLGRVVENGVFNALEELNITRDKLQITADTSCWYWTKE